MGLYADSVTLHNIAIFSFFEKSNFIRLKRKFNFTVAKSIFTARKRSLGQGNIFIGVCQEFCSQGVGVWSGGCRVWSRERCLLPGGGVSALGGVCSGGVPGGDPPHGYCCGRYARIQKIFQSDAIEIMFVLKFEIT